MRPLVRSIALLLASISAVELAVASYALVVGAVQVDLGPVRVRAGDPLKPFTISVLLGCAALWLFRRLSPETVSLKRLPPWPQRLSILALVAASFLALLSPLLMPGFPFGHDIATHLTYTYQFDRALWQGQFPVRWVESVVNGNGQALFNYYQVGLYYLVQAVHLVVQSLSLSLKATVIGLWGAGAWFTYLLFRRLDRWPAIAGALVFAWAPYLLLDVYVRAAYAEFAAIALFPGLLWAVDRFLRSGRFGALLAVPPLVGLVLVCHLPSALILGPAALAYAIYMQLAHEVPPRRAAALAPAALCGAGMAAFYLWPAVAELEAIAIGRLTSGYQDYHQHFLDPWQWFADTPGYGFSRPGAEGEMPFHLGVVQWLGVAGATALVAVPRLAARAGVRNSELAWWLSLVLIATFMTTEASAALWELVAPLAFLQFPWRFLMLVPLAGAGLAALLVSAIGDRGSQALLVVCLAVVQGYLAADQLKLARTVPREERTIDDPDWRGSDNARRTAFIDRGFDPAGTSVPPAAPSGRWAIVEGNGVLAAELVKDHDLRLTAATDDGLRVVINSRYMPGWRVLIDGQEAQVTVQREYGYMEIDVPPGTHQLHARFGDTPTRAFANRTSALSAGLWAAGLALLLAARGRRALAGRAPPTAVS
jgi:hypothetical protein